ncbi:MAG: primosomal protein N' [Flavobacteriales bacterium]|nr:primosomal protein N' [Flavobacteriales bacterium]
MTQVGTYVEVIIPLALNGTFVYEVPNNLISDLAVGIRVVVPFGAKRSYCAVVKEIHNNKPTGYEAKLINAIIDGKPILTLKHLQFWEWMGKYYMCSVGDVMNAALPAGLKIDHSDSILLNQSLEYNKNVLSDNEYLVVDALELQGSLKVEELELIVSKKSVQEVVSTLIDMDIVHPERLITERYTPKLKAYVDLGKSLVADESLLEAKLAELKRAPKQTKVLLSLLHLSNYYGEGVKEVSKEELLLDADATSATVKQLADKGVVEIWQKELDRIDNSNAEIIELQTLSESQERAYGEIVSVHAKQQIVLLHGVTSSGKTEIYMKLIQDTFNQGKQVLFLVPEIGLTTQLTRRLASFFGNRLGVYHSKFNANERVEIWRKVGTSEKSHSLIVGARSALFLPFKDLGLVIIDEEHETSYKQSEPAPRYHARDSAIKLASQFDAKVLLGTATPSVESYYNALSGKFGLVELMERFGNVSLPIISKIDLKREYKRKTMKAHLSKELFTAINDTLELGEQVMLFQNRRGYSPYLICLGCGEATKCINCDVSLTYHKGINRLKCHYCGYVETSSTSCKECGDTDLRLEGYGTEQIEEELEILFPQAKIARMDIDTTSKKDAFSRIIGDFETGVIDILIGTQMISKGFDFKNVSLVAIINSDNMLNFPDFRAFERSFQLIYQFCGRAGRREKTGKVLLQTFNPDHQVVTNILRHDYIGMYNSEIAEREAFKYPPFVRLIKIVIRHRTEAVCRSTSNQCGYGLKQQFGTRVLGPETPFLSRVRGYFIREILIKLEIASSLLHVKREIAQIIKKVKSTKGNSTCRIHIDVDPS